MKKIAIYGTGKTAAWYVEHHDFQGEELAAFIETKKKTTSFLGKPLLSVTDSLDAFDEIHVANRFPETVSALLERDIPRNKIVICNKILYNNYKSGGQY